MPVTWPRSIGQVPIYYAHDLSQIPDSPNTRYWDGSSAPLYPFGYGLSYAKFTIGNLKIAGGPVTSGGKIPVSVDVTNSSQRDGDEVVQLYTHQRAASMSRPIRELKGFERVTVKAGTTKTVTLLLDTKDLGFWSPATHKWSVEPGDFDLWVGDNAASTSTHAVFTLR